MLLCNICVPCAAALCAQFSYSIGMDAASILTVNVTQHYFSAIHMCLSMHR